MRTSNHLLSSAQATCTLAITVITALSSCIEATDESPFGDAAGPTGAVPGDTGPSTSDDNADGSPSGTEADPPGDDPSSDDDEGAARLDVGAPPGELDGDLDECSDSCVDAVDSLPMGSWLLNFGFEGPPTNPTALVLNQVDIELGAIKTLCELDGPPLEFKNFGFKSATFTRDNRLMATDGRALFEVDPCACTYTLIGRYPNGSAGIFGITPDDSDGLFAASSNSGQFVRLDPNTAEVTPIGALEFDLQQHGATYSEADGVVYLVTSTGDVLYEIDPATGEATEIAMLSQAIETVGVEIHPDTNELFVCGTVDNQLSRVDIATGMTTPLGGDPLENCSNLGAPWVTGGSVCVPAG